MCGKVAIHRLYYLWSICRIELIRWIRLISMLESENHYCIFHLRLLTRGFPWFGPNIIHHIIWSILCERNYYYRYSLRLSSGTFYVTVTHTSTFLSNWFHLVYNYIGPYDGEGIQIYYDGKQVGSDSDKYNTQGIGGDGRIAVGRYYTDEGDWATGSTEVDELFLFNKALTDEEIETIFSSYNWRCNKMGLYFVL